jgi:hypothetical protein
MSMVLVEPVTNIQISRNPSLLPVVTTQAVVLLT